MSNKKQIEEMAKVLKDYTKENHIMASHTILENYAEALYNAGYRKQSEGEWVHTDKADHWFGKDECNKCHYHTFDRIDLSHFNFCPNCGARMSGGKK